MMRPKEGNYSCKEVALTTPNQQKFVERKEKVSSQLMVTYRNIRSGRTPHKIDA